MKKRLGIKVLRGLVDRISYRRLKDTIEVIAFEKNEVNLLRKTFLIMKRYAHKKYQLRSMQKVLVLKHAR